MPEQVLLPPIDKPEVLMLGTCKCGCGQLVKGRRVFVNKEHQLEWMAAGGARELNALQPIDAKVQGGQTAGNLLANSGHLDEIRPKALEKVKQITERFRAKHQAEG